MTTYRSDYPNEPIGGTNPYWRCSECKISDPEINGRLEGHAEWCKWRIAEEEKGEAVEDNGLAEYGKKLVALGEMFQDKDTTLEDLVKSCHELGLIISFSVQPDPDPSIGIDSTMEEE